MSLIYKAKISISPEKIKEIDECLHDPELDGEAEDLTETIRFPNGNEVDIGCRSGHDKGENYIFGTLYGYDDKEGYYVIEEDGGAWSSCLGNWVFHDYDWNEYLITVTEGYDEPSMTIEQN